jgi:hypothetical protein
MHSLVRSVRAVSSIRAAFVTVVSRISTSRPVEDARSTGVQRNIVAILIAIDALDNIDLTNRVLIKIIRPAIKVSKLFFIDKTATY